jgi:hypothetical protein
MSKNRFVRISILYIKKYLAPRGCWRLILEACQIQIGRSHSGMFPCISKYMVVRVRILILSSKIIPGN